MVVVSAIVRNMGGQIGRRGVTTVVTQVAAKGKTVEIESVY